MITSMTPKTITAALLTTAAAAYYTAPGGTRSKITKLTFTNTSANVVTVTVHLVAAGGSASATNMLVPARSIGPGEVYECFEAIGQILQAGGMVQAFASTGAVVNVQGSAADLV